jgi:hypothetical protein
MKNLFIAGALLMSSSILNAAVIDFNAPLPSSTDPEGYTEQGVTFSSSGGFFRMGGAPNGTQSIVLSGDGEFMRADLSSTTSFISVDLGDFNADADRLFLSVFDNTDTLLGSITEDIASNFTGMKTLSLAFANIAYATFGSTGEIGSGGVFADNFTFKSSVSEVPVPAAAFLFAPALLGFLGLRRKAAKQA